MSLWLPRGVTRELFDQRLQREANAGQALRAQGDWDWVAQFNRELQRVDRHCKLVWCPDPAPVDAAAAGAKPGRWHVVREVPGTPLTFIAIETPDGEYLEPGSHVFDMLARMDLWDERNVRRRARREQELAAARERQCARDREERREHLHGLIDAATKVRISFSPEHRWTQNAQGARGRRQG